MNKLHTMVIMLFKKVKKIGEDDPRRILHSFKVGLTLTLVCIFYYVTPLFDGFGSSAMWAVLTVAVVMEFTVGIYIYLYSFINSFISINNIVT